MARPYMQGVRYYPQLVNEFEKDSHLMDINEDFGPLGEAILFRIRNWVFASGYYLEITIDQLARQLRRSIGSKWAGNVNKISDIINCLADIGFIDKDLMLKGVITSCRFQEIYCDLVERRKNIDISKYWLLDRKPLLNTDTNGVNVNNNGVNVNNNGVNVNKSTQIKENEIKEKEIDKNDKLDKAFSNSDFNFLTNILINHGITSLSDVELTEYDSFLEKKIKQGFSNKELLTVTNYVVKHMLEAQGIKNKIAYFIKSFEVGLKEITTDRKANYKNFIDDLVKKMKM